MWELLQPIRDFAVTNVRVVREAWGAFLLWCITALVIAVIGVWWFLSLVYETRLKNEQSTNSMLAATNQDLRSQLAARPDRPDRWSLAYSPIPQERFTSLAERLKPLITNPKQAWMAISWVDNPSAASVGNKLVKLFRDMGITTTWVLYSEDDVKAHGITVLIRHPEHPIDVDQKYIDAFRLSGFDVQVGDLGENIDAVSPFQITISYPP